MVYVKSERKGIAHGLRGNVGVIKPMHSKRITYALVLFCSCLIVLVLWLSAAFEPPRPVSFPYLPYTVSKEKKLAESRGKPENKNNKTRTKKNQSVRDSFTACGLDNSNTLVSVGFTYLKT